MKASEIIKELEYLISKHGDLEVTLEDELAFPCEIIDIDYLPKSNKYCII